MKPPSINPMASYESVKRRDDVSLTVESIEKLGAAISKKGDAALKDISGMKALTVLTLVDVPLTDISPQPADSLIEITDTDPAAKPRRFYQLVTPAQP